MYDIKGILLNVTRRHRRGGGLGLSSSSVKSWLKSKKNNWFWILVFLNQPKLVAAIGLDKKWEYRLNTVFSLKQSSCISYKQ